jgi:MYXO-CTERM domain-containing protein
VSTTTSSVSWVKASGNTAAVASGITYNGWGGYSYGTDFIVATGTGNPAPWIIVSDTASGGGSSSVPDAGPGPALALLLGGLGLRQWRRTRRTGAAA